MKRFVCFVVLFCCAPALRAEGLARNLDFAVSAPTQELAETTLREASQLRKDLALAWLGEELPHGVVRTIIHVQITPTEDRGKAWVNERRDRNPHVVWLRAPTEEMLATSLAHEVTHVVLATQFPGKLPPWADEGAASQADDPRRLELRNAALDEMARTGAWVSLAELFSRPAISPTDHAAYAASASLAEYLISLADRPTFLRFAADAHAGGIDAALKKHYRLANLRELETTWRARVSRSML